MKGSYILVICLHENIIIQIGSLGKILFSKGYYLYIGSALGNSGSSTLRNRVKRHFLSSMNKKTHWHIDYLLNNPFSNIFPLYLIPTDQNYEGKIANELITISDG